MQINELKDVANNGFVLVKNHWFLFFLSVFLNALFLLSVIYANKYVLINASESIQELNGILQEKTQNLNDSELVGVEEQLKNDAHFMELYGNIQKHLLRFLGISVLSFILLFGFSWSLIYKISEVELNASRFVLNFFIVSLLSVVLFFLFLISTPNSWIRLLFFVVLHYVVVVSLSSLHKTPLFRSISQKLQNTKTMLCYGVGFLLLIILVINNIFLFSRINEYPYFFYLSFAWLLFIILPFVSFLGVCFVKLDDE